MDRPERDQRSDEDPEYDDEELDPRIQGELEKLNQSTDAINRCETELEGARQKFRSVLVEATVKLDELVKKIGKAVEESKPYWEARRVARQAQLEAQKATQEFQRAAEVLRAAKETISLAEQRLLEEDHRHFDSAWQEMLNHATQRVMEAEHTKTRSELVHKETAAKYTAAMSRVKQLEKKLKRTINKSKPYFEMKAKYYLQLEHLKQKVDDLQARLCQAKGQYKGALRSLEVISDQIHERRRSTAMGPRGRGVGTEGDAVAAETDMVSISSVFLEEEVCGGSSIMSEEDSDTHSLCSLGSSPTTPLDLLSPYPFIGSSCSSSSSSSTCSTSSASPSPSPSPSSSSPAPSSRPCSLDLPSTSSLSDLGLVSPVLGPRSQCSGASSPDCDLERGDRAEGAESCQDNTSSNNNSSSSSSSMGTKKTLSLEGRFSFLNLHRPRANTAKPAAAVPSPAVVLVNGV
ncbi:SH3 domain-binding protein 5 [Merluccius polli]|uniref:SH3 domain-binding protein 5 n=1 Tax=Merluccius polli TaxID=89951 RepID=A0AA47N9M3_MERPO|nr:SH3 domain-binding protein 5 [Merluccius polli]